MLDRPTTAAGRADYDLNAKALRHWPVLFAMMVDTYGRPQAEIVRLGGETAPKIDPERRNQWRGRQLREFRGGPGYSSWRNGDGAEGETAADLIAYLGSCSKEKAVDWLASTLSRIVEIEPR
jgi:hypothetical protein